MAVQSLNNGNVGKKNLIAGLWAMAAFMFVGFVLVYLRDFAPNAAEWAAQYGIGKHFETRLAHVHGTLFGLPPVFVLLGALSMTMAMIIFGLALWRHKES